MISLVTSDGCGQTRDVFAGDAVDKGELFMKQALLISLSHPDGHGLGCSLPVSNTIP
jgi:hypothetical protein